LEKVFSSYGNELKAVEQQQRQTSVEVATETVVVTPKPTTTPELQEQKLANHHRRVRQQQEIKRLSEQQWLQIAIAQAVGVSVRTVQCHLAAPELSETATPNGSVGRSLLEPYKQSLLEWWNAQIRQPKVLMVLLQQQGYSGSERTLTRYRQFGQSGSRFTTKQSQAYHRFTDSDRSSIPSVNEKSGCLFNFEAGGESRC
jgi:transposase